MSVEQIIAMIQERIDSALANEQKASRDFHEAQDGSWREVAYRLAQNSIAQRIVLQSLLDEISEVLI